MSANVCHFFNEKMLGLERLDDSTTENCLTSKSMSGGLVGLWSGFDRSSTDGTVK